jgi:pimeloyl-ACP methyl ester carboxylesterase
MVEALEALVTGGVRHGLIMRGERRVRYFAMGAGSTCVVLEPGACVAASTWFPVLPAPSRHVQVILYDRAGFGGTDPVARPGLGTALEDLRAVLVDVADSGPCILVGRSWGGLLVQMPALAHPGPISGLVLVDAAHEQSRLEIPADGLERIARSDQEVDFDECVVEQAEMARVAARATTGDPVLADLLVRADLGYAYTGPGADECVRAAPDRRESRRTRRPWLALAPGHEQVAVAVFARQVGDGLLAPDLVGRAVISTSAMAARLREI